MTRWDYERFKGMLDEFLGFPAKTDPRFVKRGRILASATELFIRHGYRKTSIAEVAKGAGVAKGTLYLYYKSKPELLAHAIAEEKKRFIGRLKPILDPEISPRERLKAWLRMVFITGSEMPLTSKVLRGDAEILNVVYDFMDQRKERDWKEIQEQFVRHLVSDAIGPCGLSDTEVNERSNVILGVIHAALVMSDPLLRRGLALDRFADLFATMLVDGVIASSRGPVRPKDEEVN